MYENLTVERIKQDILDQISLDIDTREGSFTNDIISGIAYEVWKTYQSLDSIIPIAYVDETSGEYIDKRCEEYGIRRKEGTKSKTTMFITGSDGIVIPKGTVFLTDDGLEFISDDQTVISEGIANIAVVSAEVGEHYNVKDGEITRQYTNLSGISSVTNLAAAGGTNPETDVSLVARLYDHIRKPATSGNVAHYRKWALEIPGIGDAKVFPLWNGPGTVKVVIVDSNKQPVTETMIQEVSEYVEEVRPIGAAVTVVSGKAKGIDISASVILAPGYSLQNTLDAFKKALEDYFKSIAFSLSYISHAKIGNILLGVEGVLDYNDLLINGTNANILLTEEEVPVLGTVDVEV